MEPKHGQSLSVPPPKIHRRLRRSRRPIRHERRLRMAQPTPAHSGCRTQAVRVTGYVGRPQVAQRHTEHRVVGVARLRASGDHRRRKPRGEQVANRNAVLFHEPPGGGTLTPARRRRPTPASRHFPPNEFRSEAGRGCLRQPARRCRQSLRCRQRRSPALGTIGTRPLEFYWPRVWVRAGVT
jgi:hypothetical protein